MKGTFLLAAVAISAHAAVIENRQGGRPTGRPGGGGGSPGSVPNGIASHNQKREPHPQWLSIGIPSQPATIVPSNPLDRVSQCGLDAFVGHTSEALLFCSSILKGGTATSTATYTTRDTTTTRTTVYITLYPQSTSAIPSSTPPPPPTSTATPPPRTSSSPPPSSTPVQSSSTLVSSPAPTASQACGLYGYTKTTAAYYFDSSGTKNTFTACSAACKADSQCKSFGYGEANCMLFNVPAGDNVNINPLSPYTFYDVSCPSELPVRKRQVNISLNFPGGANDVSSACSCLITSGAADTTKLTTVTVTNVRVTKTETVTRTVSLLPAQRQ